MTFSIAPLTSRGTTGKGKRALAHAIRVHGVEGTEDHLAHLAARDVAYGALTSTGWASYGGAAGQAASLARLPESTLALAGLTRDDVDGRVRVIRDLADILAVDHAETRVQRADGQEPTLVGYLRHYVDAYFASRPVTA